MSSFYSFWTLPKAGDLKVRQAGLTETITVLKLAVPTAHCIAGRGFMGVGRGNLVGTGQQYPGRSLLKHPEKVGVGHFVLKPKLLCNKMREIISSKLDFPLFYMPNTKK